jgi:hypothetical protein
LYRFSEQVRQALQTKYHPAGAFNLSGGERGIGYADPRVGGIRQIECQVATLLLLFCLYRFSEQVRQALQTKKHPAGAFNLSGGERGIRTPGTCYSTPDFESGTFNRSDISPKFGLQR